MLPHFLPDDWKGGFLLLVMVFVLSSFLDNIAAALIGGTMARAVFRHTFAIELRSSCNSARRLLPLGPALGVRLDPLRSLLGKEHDGDGSRQAANKAHDGSEHRQSPVPPEAGSLDDGECAFPMRPFFGPPGDQLAGACRNKSPAAEGRFHIRIVRTLAPVAGDET